MKNEKIRALLNTPLGIMIAVAASVFGIELLFMALLHGFLKHAIILPDITWNYIDAISLTAIVTPLLYFVVFKKIHDDEERFRQINATAQDAIVIVNEQGLIAEWNIAAQRIFQYSREEALGKPLHQLITPPRFLADAERGFSRFQKNGEGPLVGKITEIAALRKGGSEFPVELSISAVNVKGSWHAIGIIRDITERMQANEKLLKLSRAVENSPASVVITNMAGTIEYVNRKFTQVTGYLPEEAIGQNPRVLNAGIQTREFYKDLWETILAGKEWQGEIYNKKKSGELYVEYAYISPIRDDNGIVTHFVAVKEDITQRKQNEQELKKAKDAAEAASRAKSEFLARMGHELLTPLNAIIGFAQVMETSADDETIGAHRDNIQTIARSGWHLHQIVKNLLGLAEIENRKVVLHIEKIDVGNCINECCELIAPLARERGVELNCALDEFAGVMVLADPFRLHEVLTNLLDNAIKYNRESGSVTISGQHMPGRFRILVSDTGQGIPEDELPTLFQPFSRLAQRSYSIEGAGVGLSMAKRLTELMGGTIGAESVVGQGSTFWIELPMAPEMPIDPMKPFV